MNRESDGSIFRSSTHAFAFANVEAYSSNIDSHDCSAYYNKKLTKRKKYDYSKLCVNKCSIVPWLIQIDKAHEAYNKQE